MPGIRRNGKRKHTALYANRTDCRGSRSSVSWRCWSCRGCCSASGRPSRRSPSRRSRSSRARSWSSRWTAGDCRPPRKVCGPWCRRPGDVGEHWKGPLCQGQGQSSTPGTSRSGTAAPASMATSTSAAWGPTTRKAERAIMQTSATGRNARPMGPPGAEMPRRGLVISCAPRPGGLHADRVDRRGDDHRDPGWGDRAADGPLAGAAGGVRRRQPVFALTCRTVRELAVARQQACAVELNRDAGAYVVTATIAGGRLQPVAGGAGRSGSSPSGWART